MQVTIDRIKFSKKEIGKYGEQIKIVFEDNTGKTISGWVPMDQYNDALWSNGNTLELDIVQNGDYTNFKLPKLNMTRAPSSMTVTISTVFEKLKEIEAKLDILLPQKSIVESAKDIFQQDKLEF